MAPPRGPNVLGSNFCFLDSVKARHQQRGTGEIGIGARVEEAHFHALAIRGRREGNAASSRAIARRIGQQHWRFKTRDLALVAVGQGIGEGVERLGMLDDAADLTKAKTR